MKDKLFRRKTKGRRNKCREDSKAGAQRPPSLSAPPPGLPRLSVPGARAVAAREAPPSPDCLRALLVIFPAGFGFKVQPGVPIHQVSTRAAFRGRSQVPHASPLVPALRPEPAPPSCPASAPGSRFPAPSGAGQARLWLLAGQTPSDGHSRSLPPQAARSPKRAARDAPVPPPGPLPSTCPAPPRASWRRCGARCGRP